MSCVVLGALSLGGGSGFQIIVLGLFWAVFVGSGLLWRFWCRRFGSFPVCDSGWLGSVFMLNEVEL